MNETTHWQVLLAVYFYNDTEFMLLLYYFIHSASRKESCTTTDAVRFAIETQWTEMNGNKCVIYSQKPNATIHSWTEMNSIVSRCIVNYSIESVCIEEEGEEKQCRKLNYMIFEHARKLCAT